MKSKNAAKVRVIRPGSSFRAAIAAEKPLQIAGVINAYAGLLAERAGFRALYLSGAGVANHSYGVPDTGTLRGWRSIHITDGDHPYMKQWWVPGLQIGYEHSFIHQMADFLSGLAGTGGAVPSFREALATDNVTDAVLRSARDRQWAEVPAATGQSAS